MVPIECLFGVVDINNQICWKKNNSKPHNTHLHECSRHISEDDLQQVVAAAAAAEQEDDVM